jgi:hypothetical protein
MTTNLTPAERALLNEQTIHGEGPQREIAPGVALAPLTFARRRLLQRAASHMVRVGASDSEQLHTYILMLALPEPEARAAARSIDDLEDALDSFFGEKFGVSVPASALIASRACFDHDIAAIEAATVDVINSETKEPGSPNS